VWCLGGGEIEGKLYLFSGEMARKTTRLEDRTLPLYASPSAKSDGGCELFGVCRICTCVKWGFLASPTGIIKCIILVRMET